MKIFIVTAGSYSDYRIEAAFSTEERAKAYIEARHGDNDLDYLEQIVDEIVDPVGLKRFVVQLDFSGDVFSVSAKSSDDYEQVIYRDGKPPLFYWGGWARDEEHAVKIAHERMMIALARFEDKVVHVTGDGWVDLSDGERVRFDKDVEISRQETLGTGIVRLFYRLHVNNANPIVEEERS